MRSVGILVFDQVEVLDFSGPFEVFSTASRVHGRRGGVGALFKCFLVSPEMRPVHARGGMKILPDCVLPPAGDIDILIIPGGDMSQILRNAVVADWIAHQSAHAEVVASVCTGAFLLAQAGLLEGRDVTTHWEDGDELECSYPGLRVRRNVPWVDCGKVVTSAGISAGIDMSLHLVARLAGSALADATARQMEYRWNRDNEHEHQRTDYPRLLPAAQEHLGAGLDRPGGSAPLCQPT